MEFDTYLAQMLTVLEERLKKKKVRYDTAGLLDDVRAITDAWFRGCSRRVALGWCGSDGGSLLSFPGSCHRRRMGMFVTRNAAED
jgi:hypothetical protein